MSLPPLISSQRYLNRATVLRKARSYHVFTVKVHECELRGRRYRMIVDGHHNLAAARLIGAPPRFQPPGRKFMRHLERLTPAQREAFLINNLTDCDHYYVDTGKVVAELLAPAHAGAPV